MGRYDRTSWDVNVTNEYFGKFYAEMKLWDVGRARANLMYASRRYDNYDVIEFVEVPGLQYSENLTAMRKFDIANRDRVKASCSSTFRSATSRPSRRIWIPHGDYPRDVINQLGVSADHGWNAGVEIGTSFGPTLKASLVYNHEERLLVMSDCCGGAAAG